MTSATSVFGHLTQFRARLRTGGTSSKLPAEEQPLRSELYSADQLERHGKTLAAAHRLTPRRATDPLLPRLAANESVLLDVCRRLGSAVSANQRIIPAGEWLLDNFHLIHEQIGTAKRHLPRGYSRELPRLVAGASGGLPRVYDIALEAISHGDGRVDAESLRRFVSAYQTVNVLKLGELWAIPIMLRLALIENLRRVGVRVAAGLGERDLATAWADRMMQTAERRPKDLIVVIADMARSSPPMHSAFVAELARRLQGQSAALALALTWIEQHLAESHQTIERLVQIENQRQASDQVSISNSIGSLRSLGAIDWREFVESVSVVEATLRLDPADVYRGMEFATRDSYRHATERIAREGRLGEADVAAAAIELAQQSARRDPQDRRAAHVGFYLVDKGAQALESVAGVEASLAGGLRKMGQRNPLALFLGPIAAITLLGSAGLAALAHGAGASREVLVLIAPLLLLANSQFAVSVVNWLATLLLRPSALPRMDYTSGIPPGARTLVVIPTMLSSIGHIEELVDALEIRFLANRDVHLHFGLLTDFSDASEAVMPDDEALLRLAQARIEALNLRHGQGDLAASSHPAIGVPAGTGRREDGSVFYLFHRPRQWNPAERRWMGRERKRGKLADLNALLREGRAEGFSLVIGATAILSKVKYVITLDTDTQLPRDSARHFVGAMAHPLNAAHFGAPGSGTGKDIVASGYGILQPRVSMSLPGASRSRYARLHGGDTGVDPYTRTVSDVYQDAFGQGSFTGKGIYDVDAFERALKGRFRDNRVLSHDLLEGCYARAGLLSDAELYEDFPPRYSADVARRRRWMRGDWQLAGWLRRHVKRADGRLERNPLSMLSQWKVFDNLRRSLVPVALTALLLIGWTAFPPAWLWSAVVLGVLAAPALLGSLADLVRRPAELPVRQHLGVVAGATRRRMLQALLELTLLPYEALLGVDAMLRTLWRLLVSHRNLLEWRPSGEVDAALDRSERTDLVASYRSMAVAPAIAVIGGVGLFLAHPAALPVAAPILLLWVASPAITWWLSLPLNPTRGRLTTDQRRFLRRLARRTWGYFETYVGADDNWLPPDNVQEHPALKIAHRTSPTNMGMALLATLAAHDFGYLSGGQLLRRVGKTLDSMETLERHRGHFYNWYDTRTRLPLAPLYVSTVDSGNLAGHLLTLVPGLRELCDAPVLNRRWVDGIRDTFRILSDAVGRDLPVAAARFEQSIDRMLTSVPPTLHGAHVQLQQLVAQAMELAGEIDANLLLAGSEASFWGRALASQCADLLEDLTFLVPWLKSDKPGTAGAAFVGDGAIPSLRQLAALEPSGLSTAPSGESDSTAGAPGDSPGALRELVGKGRTHAAARMAVIEHLALQANAMAVIDYAFLFDKVRRQLAIGYNVSQRRCDEGHYDLLASEARLCTFVAIAQGALPQESWFVLGRSLAPSGGGPVLLSWSGSMFEYLMPLLVMPTYDNTLLDQTYRAAVARQIEYGKQRDVPWGMSESGYNTVDVQLNYQYRAFGVPGLGLKRGLGDDLVVAPYASALALMVAPDAACQNLRGLADIGLAGRFGLFEAIDYTPSRQPRGETGTVVRSFMAHHQGMSLLAIAYALLDRPMQKRFESDALFQATMLLLQERVPKATSYHARSADLSDIRSAGGPVESPVRLLTTPHTIIPEVLLLSNGRYHVMVTNAGGGSSRWKDLAVTRWSEDGTRDNWGTYCYLRNVDGGEIWSTAYHPTLQEADHYEAIFSEGRAEFRRIDFDFETHTEIVVSPEDDIEVRRVHITNRAWTSRTVEITTYAEVVLAPAAADALHPAFSNLFVQTEILPERAAILCTRRPRSLDEAVPWSFHLMSIHGRSGSDLSFETDRSRFIGRGRSLASPAAMIDAAPLSGTAGSVLDPITAIRGRVLVEAGATVTIDLVSGAGETRDAVVQLVDKYQDRNFADRVFELTWTHSQVVLRQLNATEADSQLYGRLAGSVIYTNPALRAAPGVLAANRRGQSGLWGYAISGDLPIVLLQIADASNIELVRQLVQAHAYWRLKGLAVDLVIWNEDHDGYRQRLQEQIIGLVAAGIEPHTVDRPGGIFVRHAEQISPEDRVLFCSTARVLLSDRRGTLADQMKRRVPAVERSARLAPRRGQVAGVPAAGNPRSLTLFNGTGGFSRDGREYVVAPADRKATPAPWVNVVANPGFGTVISESGLGYTWSENAHLFRLTPWHNDPVCEPSGEAVYLRDDESGHFWTPTPAPRGGAGDFVTRHGFGYTVFEHVEDGIRSELSVFVALDAAVKFFALKVGNVSGRARKLSATGYVEWVLGDMRAKSAMHVATEVDVHSGALYARNPYNSEFGAWIGFFDVDESTRTLTGDRTEFIGRNGTLHDPAALHHAHLSGRVGPGLDPCAALQVAFELESGREREIVFRLGAAASVEGARDLVLRFRGGEAAGAALDAVVRHWHHTLSAVVVDTPDVALNVLTNGWLVYQTMACRLWARSGYYQSGGAFGFRDQLQDVMALVHADPGLLRAQITLCASRQFAEGDVQHWWHPPSGRGVRTHCSDDYLWLPLAASRYVLTTGDVSLLEEVAPFLEGRAVNAEDDSYYDLPGRSDASASIYQHCVKAIVHGLRFGAHGLPLIGSGDWNDGMNLVGRHGRGESVWLAFFLCHVLREFAKVAHLRADHPFAERCETEAARLGQRIEQNAWDGEWYRRAYFDDGSPLGSAANAECQIDSISQSWSVLSGTGDRARSIIAMNAVDRRLVRRDHALIQLLDPPFDRSGLEPGYIRGYVPGVRENGGQYTHSAVWTAMAFAALGDAARAWELTTMINPLNHALTPAAVATYKVEPYVVAADVYSSMPHTGRGGWTWYTGSAGWMYRLVIESLLGISLEADRLRLAPCMSPDWNAFTMRYRYRHTYYDIEVRRADERDREGAGFPALTVDGVVQEGNVVSLVDDRRDHRVEMRVFTGRDLAGTRSA